MTAKYLRVALWRIAALCLVVLAAPATAQHSDAGGAFAGHTILTWQEGIGAEVEYFEPDGAAHLWTPTQREVLRGFWRAEPGRICFAYPSKVGGEVGFNDGEWFCKSAERYFSEVVAKRENDRYELRGTLPPFLLREGEFFSGFDALDAAISEGRR